ncbi:AAA domain-containing protein [Planotetraspora sp. A-T 1434]|uniref:AAA domain-containing protein n=1 Tax=Planotetraspora sp. A-T 1434 TaxID=2979219 RepID=UPI0021C0B7CB|nr:AAA domain-containing protein [Planotetraspora sp. A-T 1434]MCT9932281.1 AAA domain-containing protein [Planotetraspora sp. A-T 1434]
MDWRDEVATALSEWIGSRAGSGRREGWQRIGAARATAEPGVFVVDIRGFDFNPDLLDKLRLSGAENDTIRNGFPVMDAVVEGQLLRVRVAEFADPADPHVWRRRESPTFLLTSLRDGIANLTDAGLANLLARGEIGGNQAAVSAPPGLLPAQAQAYRACLGTGVWLVWGPPGTGKTRLLQAALEDLMAAGKRILLVSATNIAVDNALRGVLKKRRHQPGQIVRVGPPQLREVAEDHHASLPLLVRARLTELEKERGAVAATLLEMRRDEERLRHLEARLVRFDVTAYQRARARLRTLGRDVASLTRARRDCEQAVEAGAMAVAHAQRWSDAAEAAVTEALPYKQRWRQVEVQRGKGAQVEEAATQAEADALLAEGACTRIERERKELRRPSGKVRWWDRRKLAEIEERLADARAVLDERRSHAAAARATAERFRRDTERAIADFVRDIPLSPDEIRQREDAARREADRLSDLQAQQLKILERLESVRRDEAASQAAQELVAESDRHEWPAQHAEAEELRRLAVQNETRRAALEKRHGELQEQYERLARDAEGEIVSAASLVATTLARSRTNKAVCKASYDVVLIDEVGAAALPEVLLATANAAQCAVLLGDFLQLGPVLPKEIKESARPDVQRWLVPDVFEHCGITSPETASGHPGCLVMDTQHRFGPHVMDLANRLAYGGVLKAGSGVRARPEDDPEIVFVNTDGLHELAEVRRMDGGGGWWPAGLLLARALLDLHQDDGETTGVVTPYRAQAEATLEALRDVEQTGRPLAEVGTAHRFQGREFGVVVFDTVEGQDGPGMWMAQASLLPGAGRSSREGLRLFNVAVTRVQTRLYIIGSRHRLASARAGTALGHVADLRRERKLRFLEATDLIAPPAEAAANLGPVGARLADVLSRHVEITAVDDERSFYETFKSRLDEARASIWLWSPWVAKRVRSILPALRDAVARGVRVTVFVRDPSDTLQQKESFADCLADLRAIVPTVVEVNDMHQKIVVIDERTVMLGSLNTLSQSRTREVMLTLRGGYFARKILDHEHAQDFSRPQNCGACHQFQVDLRRRKNGTWYWRCYNKDCPGRSGNRAWTADVRFRTHKP